MPRPETTIRLAENKASVSWYDWEGERFAYTVPEALEMLAAKGWPGEGYQAILLRIWENHGRDGIEFGRVRLDKGDNECQA